MKANRDKNNSWALMVVFCLVVIFSLSYLVIPKYHASVKKLNLDLAVNKEKINKTQQKINDLNYLKTQFEGNQALRDNLNLALPKDNQYPESIISLQTMGTESGMVINNIQPSKSVTNGSSIINLSLSGNYDSFKSFLEKIEKNIRPIAITTLIITQSNAAKDQAGGNLDITLALNLFQVKSSTAVSQSTK